MLERKKVSHPIGVTHVEYSPSLCKVNYSEIGVVRYKKNKKLGEGRTGIVHQYKAVSHGGAIIPPSVPRKIVIKGYKVDINLAPPSDWRLLVESEVFNYNQMNGVAYSFVVEHKNKGENLIQPFILMDYVKGKLFDQYHIANSDEFFAIVTATLIELQKIHDNRLLHMDIKGDNVIIGKDNNNKITIRFIDASSSHLMGGTLHCIASNLRNNHRHLPPERFALTESFIKLTPSYDVYSLGVLFKDFLNRYHRQDQDIFFSYLKNDIVNIFDLMKEDISGRISIRIALQELHAIQQRYAVALQFYEKLKNAEIKNDISAMGFFLFYLTRLVLNIQQDFNVGSFDTLEKTLNRFLQHLQDAKHNIKMCGISIVGYIKGLFEKDVDGLFFSLHLLKSTAKLELLRALHHHDNLFFANLLQDENHIETLQKILSPDDLKHFLEVLYQSKLETLEKNFSNDESEWLAWLYCTVKLYQIRHSTYDHITDLLKDWPLLNRNEQNNDEINAWVGSMLVNPSPHIKINDIQHEAIRQRYAILLFKKLKTMVPVNPSSTNPVIKKAISLINEIKKDILPDEQLDEAVSDAINMLMDAIIDKIWQKHNTMSNKFYIFKASPFKEMLKEVDEYQHCGEFYQELLLASNRLYYRNRKNNQDDYYTKFGKHSRDDKLAASLAITTFIQEKKGSIDNLPPAANQGDLNALTSRLKGRG